MTAPRSIFLLVALLACAGAALASGCGEKQDELGPGGTRPVELMLDYFPNADHAGIYAAQAGGEFKRAGLDVKIRQPATPSAPIKQVAAGRVDLAVSYEPEVLRARDQGLKVVAVASVVRRPLTSIISLPKAKIRSPKDLRGKTVGTAGIDYQSAYLQTIAGDAGLDTKDVKRRDVGFSLVPALLSGRVDAILGGFWNYEGVELAQKGKKPRIIRVDDAGVPRYDELVLVANEDALERDDGKLRTFIGALGRGTRDLRNDPEHGIEGLLKANRDLDPKLQRAAVKRTTPLFLAPAGKPFGYLDGRAWQRFAAWMRENQLLKRIPDASGAYTNELLPGAGV